MWKRRAFAPSTATGIMEIAVVMLDGTVAFHSLVNPGIPIPEFVAG